MLSIKQASKPTRNNHHSVNLIDGLIGLNGTCRHLLANLIASSDDLREASQQLKEQDLELTSPQMN